MSSTVQQLLVAITNSLENLHSNSYSLEAMNIVVAPMACRLDRAMLLVLARKLSNSTTAIW